jgi:hypothetical protein
VANFNFPKHFTLAGIGKAIRPMSDRHVWEDSIDWKKPVFPVTLRGKETLRSAQELVGAFHAHKLSPQNIADLFKEKGLRGTTGKPVTLGNIGNRLHIHRKALEEARVAALHRTIARLIGASSSVRPKGRHGKGGPTSAPSF